MLNHRIGALLPILLLLNACHSNCGLSVWQALLGKPCPKDSEVEERVPCLGLNPDSCELNLTDEVMWTNVYALPVSSTRQFVQDVRVFYRFFPDSSYEQTFFVTMQGHILMEKRSGRFELINSFIALQLNSTSCEGMKSVFAYFDAPSNVFAVSRDQAHLEQLAFVLPETVEALMEASVHWIDGLVDAIKQGSFEPYVEGIMKFLVAGVQYAFTNEFWMQLGAGPLAHSATTQSEYETYSSQAFTGCLSKEGLVEFVDDIF